MSNKQLFKKILVPVDGSHSCLHAKMLAASIAKKFKSKVTVVHVASHEFMHPELKAQYQLPHSILHKVDEAYLQAGKKIIRNAEEMFREAGITVDSKLVTHEDPAEFLLELIKSEKYCLVVIGNRAESQSERYSLGSVTEKVARHSECPVLIVKQKPKVEKILTAVDGSKYANKALEYAVELTKSYSANLALLHVEEDKLVRIGGPQVMDCLGTVGECILKDASTKVQGVKFDKMLEYGSPAEIIIKVAKKADVDIIVVGSRGLSSVRRYLLGSVSDDISMHARSSVLIVR
ncbi:MAG: universal stress protein [Candidatus Bathyarchaeota archaeon]|nr:universal stress protein [Candidatus Bathyarchaeum sp.]